MQIFIYYYSQLGVARADIEAELEQLLQGRGEVTGSGGGLAGGNIDLEIETDKPDQVVAEICQLLRTLDFPRNTILDVDGRRVKLYGDNNS